MTKHGLNVGFLLVTVLLVAVLGAIGAGAESRRPATELLLPFFEVAVDQSRTTVFDLVNEADHAVPVQITVHTQWGIALGELETRLTLAAGEVLAVDLGSWLLNGRLPGKTLSQDDLRHAQAALAGEASALTGLYYATPVDELDAAKLLVGSVRIRVDARGSTAPRALWGNGYVIDSGRGSAQAEALADLSPADGSCSTHGVRLLEGRGFDAGTELLLWTAAAGRPSRDARYDDDLVETRIVVYDEDGDEQARVVRYFEPLEKIRAGELGLPVDFGWLEVETEVASVLLVRYGAGDRYSVAVGSSCLEERAGAIELEKHTNGVDADFPPGVLLDFGDRVEWTYEVTNAGDVTLTGIQVTDNDPRVAVRCPDDTLAAGESMTCTSSGVATSCAYQNIGHVTAITLDGESVRDFDPSNYSLRQNGRIGIDVLVGGAPAGQPPGPALTCGALVDWSFVVHNTGGTPLDEVTVTNDLAGTVFCPQDRLAAGQSMTCTARILAREGSHQARTVVSGTTPCGVRLGTKLTSYYRSTCPAARIDVEKYTNGEDADLPPGPQVVVGDAVRWTYVVTNPGPVTLNGVTVIDDDFGAVPCPRSWLVPGEAMVCSVADVAVEGSYRNEARATGTSAAGETVSDVDASHYFGVAPR